MDARSWQKIEALFQRALDCAADERAALLDAHADVDEDVAAAVRDMLAADQGAGPSIRAAIRSAAGRLESDRAGVDQLRRSIVSWISLLTR